MRHSTFSVCVQQTQESKLAVERVSVLTCRVCELLLSDLFQLEDLLQGLRDLGSTNTDLLILPQLKKQQ